MSPRAVTVALGRTRKTNSPSAGILAMIRVAVLVATDAGAARDAIRRAFRIEMLPCVVVVCLSPRIRAGSMPSRGQQTLQFEPYRNSALYSSHWLENRLRLEPEWTEHRADAEAAPGATGLPVRLWCARHGAPRNGSFRNLASCFVRSPVDVSAAGARIASAS
ncbi:MAG: hypothetical protein WD069_15090 [Planctomycetales bacterium]